MEDDLLYLVEVLIEKIVFDQIMKAPNKKRLKIVAKIGTLASLEIHPENLSGREVLFGADGNEIEFNLGNSQLFTSKPQELLDTVSRDPLELTIGDKISKEHIGSVQIGWNQDVLNMVKSSQNSSNYISSAAIRDAFELKHSTGPSVGKIFLSLRLSCFGRSVETQFQVMGGGFPDPTKFVFKNTNTSTTFHCLKYVPETPSDDDKKPAKIAMIQLYKESELERKNSALEPLLAKSKRLAHYPHIANVADLSGSFLIRPGENKHSDLMKVKRRQSVLEVESTADKIGRMLCKCKDCPAARKFKEFGIGPLATGKGLGTVYGPTDIPLSYGMSNTYGVMETYGPYGVFTRPKIIEIPQKPCYKNPDEIPQEPCYQDSIEDEDSCGCCVDSAGCCGGGLAGGSTVLRLKGGGGSLDDDSENKIPTPMGACKGLLADYDKVLNAYKMALGPCGKTTCPFAPNLFQNNCIDTCGADAGPAPPTDSISACGVPKCPGSRKPSNAVEEEFRNKQIKAACGSPVCPYTKKKINLDDGDDLADAKLDRPFKPPGAVTDPCGGSTCPIYMPQPEPLQPIHWDCPDPLPKGLCKNPNCPLLPKLLQSFKAPCAPPKPESCPYAKPACCGQPGCPMGPPAACPFAPKPPTPPCAPPPCPNPKCPFAPKPACPPPPCCPPCPNAKPQPKCPFEPYPCPLPKCPFAPPPCACPPPQCPGAACPPPNCPCCPPPPPCPFLQPQCPFDEVDNPCPFSSPAQSGLSESMCDNPDCPYAASLGNADDICSNPDCPFANNNDDMQVCSNPDCPFAKKPSPCYLPCPPPPCPPQPCPPPACPPSPCPHGPPCMPPPCGGPVNICNIPNCPYSTPLPPCYGQPCPPSPCPGIPCPPLPCPSPHTPCPPAEPCAISISEEEVCSNPNCPFATKKPSPCYLPQQEADVCPNPSCPLAKKHSPCAKKPSPCAITPQPCPPPPCMNLPPCGMPNCPYDFGSPPMPPYSGGGGGGVGGSGDCGRGDTSRSDPGHGASDHGDLSRARKKSDISQTRSSTSKGQSHSEPALIQNPPSENMLNEPSHSDKGIAKPHEGKKKKFKKSSKFVYGIGDKYPGVQVGHKACVLPGFPVPAKMGWLWNLPLGGRLKPRKGWRPGIVGRSIAAVIEAHRRKKGCKLLEPLRPPRAKKRGGDDYYSSSEEEDPPVVPKPTLLIRKEKGSYYITMNPLKDPKTLLENENPYMDCTPMQFKITRNKDEGKSCFCNSNSESSDSELDIEFTPPAGIIRPERLVKHKPITHIETQYDPKDFTPPKPKGAKGKDKKDGKGKKGKGKKK